MALIEPLKGSNCGTGTKRSTAGVECRVLAANQRKDLHLSKRWRRAEGCCVVYYCGSFVFLLILLKKVLKQETIALDVKAEVSMKCENIDTDEPLTHLNQTICPSQNQSGELIEQNDPRDFFLFVNVKVNCLIHANGAVDTTCLGRHANIGAVLFSSDVDNLHGWTGRAGAERPPSSRAGYL